MTILHDLRYAVRTLRRMPVFTAAALFSLTLGIASSAADFSLVDAAMLRTPATSSNNVVTLTGSSAPEPLAIDVVSPAYLQVMRAPRRR